MDFSVIVLTTSTYYKVIINETAPVYNRLNLSIQ